MPPSGKCTEEVGGEVTYNKKKQRRKEDEGALERVSREEGEEDGVMSSAAAAHRAEPHCLNGTQRCHYSLGDTVLRHAHARAHAHTHTSIRGVCPLPVFFFLVSHVPKLPSCMSA